MAVHLSIRESARGRLTPRLPTTNLIQRVWAGVGGVRGRREEGDGGEGSRTCLLKSSPTLSHGESLLPVTSRNTV